MDLAPGMGGHDAVHEVEELDAAATLVMARHNLAIGDVEGGKQRRSAVPRVVVCPAGQGAPVRQLEVALGALQRLDVRFLIPPR